MDKSTKLLFSPFVLIVFLIAFLTSCTHVSRNDGPPHFYVDETKIPNAVPKPEARAKYGNMPFYHVFGKRYYTLKSSKNYEKVGVASWYGTKFHAQRTSSGERYDMLAMTAAHKTLPLPTYVEVTNLRNHRKVIVKVNDRGPFSGNRLIDLSYVAAKKLGIVGHGTGLVKIKAINPHTHHRDLARPMYFAGNHSTRAKVKPQQEESGVYLQVGAFRNKTHAQRLQQRLATLFEAPVTILSPKAHGQLYRVKIGPIKDAGTASKITRQLKTLGIKSNKTYEV